MTPKINPRKWLATLLLASVTSSSQASDQDSLNWIVETGSPTLDRSSAYLAAGNLKAGIRYARRALQRSNSPYRDLIAHHNLCLALNLTGDGEASDHCDTASAMTMPDIAVTGVKPGIYKISKYSHETGISMADLLRDNLNSIRNTAVAAIQQPGITP